MGITTIFTDVTIVNYSSEKKVVFHDVSNSYGKRLFFRGITKVYLPKKKSYKTCSCLFEAKDSVAERLLQMKLRIGSCVNLTTTMIPEEKTYYAVYQVEFTASGGKRKQQLEEWTSDNDDLKSDGNPSKVEKEIIEGSDLTVKDTVRQSCNLDLNDAFISNSFTSEGLFSNLQELN